MSAPLFALCCVIGYLIAGCLLATLAVTVLTIVQRRTNFRWNREGKLHQAELVEIVVGWVVLVPVVVIVLGGNRITHFISKLGEHLASAVPNKEDRDE